VHRVILHGQTVFLDGLFCRTPSGKDVSAAIISHTTEKPAAVHPVPSSPLRSFLHLLRPLRQMQTDTSVGVGTIHGPVLSQQTLTHFVVTAAFPPSPHSFGQNKFTHVISTICSRLAHEMRLQVERSGAIDILRGKGSLHALL